MARMPGAVWRPLPGSSTTKMTAYDITCFHTMVGSLDGTDNYFRTQATGTNSHFGVGGDGTIYQWVDTVFRSGANLNGNYHIVSAETADMGTPFGPWGGSDVPAWTPQQIDALARIARWVHDTHGIPLTEIPDAKPGRRGVGYHRLGVPGYMVAGAEQWSTSQGKVCPGDRRIAQVPEVIAAAGNQEDDLTPDQANQLQQVYNALFYGGPSLPGGLPLAQAAAHAVWQSTVTRADATGKLQQIPAIQELADAKTAALAADAAAAPVIDEAKLAAALLSNPAAVQALGKAIADNLQLSPRG